MMKLLVLALCLVGVALGSNWKNSPLSSNRTSVTRDIDGGEGEFTAVCALEGYYQFYADNAFYDFSKDCCSDDPGIPSSSVQLLAHFYQSGTTCYADVMEVSWVETWCYTEAEGGPLEDSRMQTFTGKSFNFVVDSFSQSQPSLYLSTDCCQTRTVMFGLPVKDVNADGFKNCYTGNLCYTDNCPPL